MVPCEGFNDSCYTTVIQRALRPVLFDHFLLCCLRGGEVAQQGRGGNQPFSRRIEAAGYSECLQESLSGTRGVHNRKNALRRWGAKFNLQV